MCEAWNKLVAFPNVIKSIGMREWRMSVDANAR
jgi:hypothetical protein